MVRTTSTLVQKLLVDSYKSGTDLTPFIETASIVVDQISSYAVSNSITLYSATAEMIERWLAAHYYAQQDRTYAAKKTGNSGAGAAATFDGKTGMFLESTMFGQTAMTLDPTGFLASLNNQVFANADWLGKPESEQIDYNLRNGLPSY